ncbi:MAG: hypothetical protein IT385_10090 [Deltaproteobacteria bacterium]|nr:hypothetical protein [Deltaproteobacteria bacterium]
MLKVVLMACGVVLSAGACGTTMIENTEIPATEENKAIYGRVLEYRRAMEARDADKLIAMVSRRYIENGETTDDPNDDYGYDELRDRVVAQFRDNVLEVQLRILLRRIEVDGDRAHADYEYFYNYKFVEGGVTGWRPKNDFNRLEFVREDGQWMIAGGL